MKNFSYWFSLPLSSQEEMDLRSAAAVYICEWRRVLYFFFPLRLRFCVPSKGLSWFTVLPLHVVFLSCGFYPQLLVGLVDNLTLLKEHRHQPYFPQSVWALFWTTVNLVWNFSLFISYSHFGHVVIQLEAHVILPRIYFLSILKAVWQ